MLIFQKFFGFSHKIGLKSGKFVKEIFGSSYKKSKIFEIDAKKVDMGGGFDIISSKPK